MFAKNVVEVEHGLITFEKEEKIVIDGFCCKMIGIYENGMGRQKMKFPRFLSVFSTLLTLLCSSVSFAQGMGAPPDLPNKEAKTPKKDPLLIGAFAPIPMDDETKEALKRANTPGVLLSDDMRSELISKIEIRGTIKVQPDAMLMQLKTHINRPFDKSLIKEDIKRLYAVGMFTSVEVNKFEGPNGSIELAYILKEKPTLFKIKFEGNDNMSESDLSEAIDLERYHVADTFRIKESAEKIRKKYAEKGFYLVTVKYRLEETTLEDLNDKDITSVKSDNKVKPQIIAPQSVGPDFRNLVYEIDEGDKIRIDRISFSGNKKFSTEELREAIFSRENHPFGAVTNWGTFNEEMSEADGQVLEQFYMDRGYLNVVVGKPRVGMSSDKTRFSIHIPVQEGEIFTISDVDISGDFVVEQMDFSEETSENPKPQLERKMLLSRITSKKGDVFNRSQLGKELQGISDVFKDLGYAYANIYPKMNVNDQERSVGLNLTVDAGPRVQIERIDIFGNFKTAEEVIRRELRVYEGENYSSTLIKWSEMRLNQLGYFENVKISTKEGSTREKMVVEVQLEERKTGSFTVGGGYGTGGEGLLFQSQIQQNNLFGRGQTLTGSVQWSGYRRIFDIRFVDPYMTYFADAPLSLSLSAFNTDRFMGEFKRASTGGDLSLGYPIGHSLFGISQGWMRGASPWLRSYIPDFENLRLFVSYGVERVEIGEVSSGLSLIGLHPLQPRYTTALRPTLQFDQRNDRMFPSAGYVLELRTEIASLALGAGGLAALENSFMSKADSDGLSGGRWFSKPEPGTNNYFRLGYNTRFYFNFDNWLPFSGFVFRLNFDLGFMKTFGEDIVSENYRMGGVGVGNVTGLRGYRYQSIGPVLGVGRDRENQILHQFILGGNKQLLLNLELEIPILKSMKLTGVLFFDIGNVYGPDENLFYMGGTRNPYYTSNFADPVGTFYGLGLYSSVGFGFRWFSPMAPLRVEFGFPLVKRPSGTPGNMFGDLNYQMEFNIGQSF